MFLNEQLPSDSSENKRKTERKEPDFESARKLIGSFAGCDRWSTDEIWALYRYVDFLEIAYRSGAHPTAATALFASMYYPSKGE